MGSASNDRIGTDDEVDTVLTFSLDSSRYCISAGSVVSVLGIADDSTLADADDPWNAGTITVTDERISVVDLPRVFGSTFRTSVRVDNPELLVLDVTDDDGYYYGWLVDDVDGPRTVRPESLEPSHMNTTHVKGRVQIDGTKTVWLNEQAIHR
ncbi:chemotaxis protein CheW [Natrinema halophilum]|uniref:Chemotaxis protein CheW n=1 Tax=Natrinema halophilum TaxID=1699371 RepID=A0A7D5GNM3_9EURY|nr:chemotaxis protein CheW [Natrinema halophilum]QLG51032.1 chemotaxis protein CheW [Natrinema halophilum]